MKWGSQVTQRASDGATEQEDAQPEQPRLRPTFAELGAHPEIVRALSDQGIITAFPIQEQTLPLAMNNQDLIGQAKTGTGKTLAFGIPILQRIAADASPAPQRKPRGLVVCPTRELAIQVASDLERAGRHLGVVVTTVYGGRSYEPQIEALRNGVDVVVGTPGRILDLSNQRYLVLNEVEVLVLDEADEMLDMGFLPDVERIVAQLPTRRQTLLFSATMPAQIAALARRYMISPTHIRASDPDDSGATVAAIEQHIWRAHPMDKVELISRILQARDRSLVMVFTETKRRAQVVADELSDRGFAAAAVHGDLGQAQRERALRAFRNGKVDILIATDVAARGIDVEDVSHVVNYECPSDEKTYVHRIGRTGRAGASGVAITLVDWEDTARWKMINKALGLAFFEPVETYSSSPHIYSELGIPTDARGRLPRGQQTREGLGAEELEDIGETGQHRSSPKSPQRSDAGRSGKQRGNRQRSRTKRAGDATGTSREDAAPSTDQPGSKPSDQRQGSRSGRSRRRRKRVGGEGTPAGESSQPGSPRAE
jgi:superfamily II DNA/RNA helicase